jgi:hypothetical protein
MNDKLIEFLLMVTMILFIVVFVVVCGVTIFFYVSRNVTFKRKWCLPFGISWAVVFVILASAITVLRTRDLSSLWFSVILLPIAVLIAYLSAKSMKFCDRCGATVINRGWPFQRRGRFCPHCGAEFEQGSE